ncbi:MAG: hypothetical protein ABF608_09245, partial [Sporolactobacillus sp.]
MKLFFRGLDLFNAACLFSLLVMAQVHQLHLSNNLQFFILSAVIASVLSAYMHKKGGRLLSAAAYFFAISPILHFYTSSDAPMPFDVLVAFTLITVIAAGWLKLSTYFISLGFFFYLLLLNYFPLTHLDEFHSLTDWMLCLGYQLNHGLISQFLHTIYMLGFFPAAYRTITAAFQTKDDSSTSYPSNRTRKYTPSQSYSEPTWKEPTPDYKFYSYTEQSNSASYFSNNDNTDKPRRNTSQTKHEEVNHSGYKSWQADYDNDRLYSGYPTWARDKAIYERDYGKPWYDRDELEEDRQREEQEEREREEEERRHEEEEEDRRREEEEEDRRREE